MTKKDIEIVSNREDDGMYDVTLPVSQGMFSEFLGKIIGGKDKLQYRFLGEITLNRNVIVSLEGAINDRVEHQYGGKVVSTRYGIRFTDGKGFKTDSLQKLLELTPSNDSITQFFSAEYVSLITYPNTNTPAKETISLNFRSGETFIDNSLSHCEVEYVNRISAEDTLNTIKSIVDTKIENKKEVVFLRKYSFILGPFFPALVFLISSLVYCSLTYFLLNKANLWFPIENNSSSLSLEDKVNDMLLRFQPYLLIIQGLIFLVIGSIVCLMPSLYLMDKSDSLYRSEHKVIFNIYDNDKLHIERLAQNKSRRKIKVFKSAIFSVLLSIVASFIYSYFAK